MATYAAVSFFLGAIGENIEKWWSPEAQSSLIDSDVVNLVLAHGSLGIGCVLILTGALKLETTIPEAPERAF